MTQAEVQRPVVRAVFLVRDKDGRPKFDLPMRDYSPEAQAAFRASMSDAEIKEFFG